MAGEFLVIELDGGPLEVPVQHTGASERPHAVRLGHRNRSFSGGLLSTVRGHKREWSFTSGPISEGDFQLLEEGLALGVHRACTGTAMRNESITCGIDMEEVPYVADGLGHMRIVNLILLEE